MKRITFFILLSFSAQLHAQNKETVYSIVKEIHDKEWYEEQFELWKKEAEEGTNTPNDWFNYYSACRALMNICTGEEKQAYYKKGPEIAAQLLKEHPKTFEAHYIAMWSSGLSNKAVDHMWKAYEINPNDPRLYDDLLIEYVIEQNEVERKAIAEKMVTTNYLAPGIMNWGYNVLSEVSENGIVLSAGDNDTYALWLNKFALKQREDVTILNVHMLLLPEYRQRYFDKLQIPNIDQEGLTIDKVIAHVMQNNNGIPVHIATTAHQCVNNARIDSNLYLTGLTYQYSETPLDNGSLIRRNFEQRFALDYLKLKFSYHQMDQIAMSFNYTYVAAMVKLYKMYDTTGEKSKKEWLAVLMDKASENGPMAEEIQKIIH